MIDLTPPPNPEQTPSHPEPHSRHPERSEGSPSANWRSLASLGMTWNAVMTRGNGIWSQWSRYERTLISVTSCILFLYLFYILIESPLQTALTQTRSQVQDSQSTLNWITHMHSRLKSVHPAKHVSTSELLGILHEKFTTNPTLQPFPAHLTQQAKTQIILKFEKVPFNLFLNLLWQLNQQYHFEVMQLQTKRTEVPGIAEVSCVIEI
ncbi:MAG: type II secretion system protein GspM [Gammaproteobacteria bacterium]|nr:type II secretion system protein GspM [Gammaproteobacteria bacterium]